MIGWLAVCSWVAAAGLVATRRSLPPRLARFAHHRRVPPARRSRLVRRAPAAAGVVAGVFLHPALGLALLAAVWVHRRWRAARVTRIGAAQVAAAMPELVDLVAAGIAAGCSARHAVVSSRHVAPPALRPALARLAQRLDRGERFADALQHLAEDLGEPARAFSTALRAHERDGVPLRPTLERIATDAHRQRRQLAEAAVRRLPVRLSVPLVTCTLSAFVVLTVIPLAGATLRSLAGELPPAAAAGDGLGTPVPESLPPAREVTP